MDHASGLSLQPIGVQGQTYWDFVMTLPAVSIHVLGGTITMAPGADGITPQLTGDVLTAGIPGLDAIAKLDVHTPFLKPGASLTMDDIARVAQSIASDTHARGSVLVQGTDTIDETSFLLQLLHEGSSPIVVTGAMRGAAALSADGPANLTAAISVAAATQVAGQGVLVVLNDEIHHAVAVEKMHKGLTNAFESPNGGPLGFYFEGRVRLVRTLPQAKLPRFKPARFGKVALIKVSLDDDTDLLQALASMGYEGAVVEAMGAGHVPQKWSAALGALAEQMPVVLTTRAPGGPVFRNTYGFPGSEIDLLKQGLIPGAWLSPQKARLLLAVAIGSDMSHVEICDAFEAFEF